MSTSADDVHVDFYAEVDPNHAIAETDEYNNCYPEPKLCFPWFYRSFHFIME